VIAKLKKEIHRKREENSELDKTLEKLASHLESREKLQNLTSIPIFNKGKKPDPKSNALKGIVTRRRLMDLAKPQAQDIAILSEEVERLRLRTFPTFSS
jgi:hypothetical protein